MNTCGPYALVFISKEEPQALTNRAEAATRAALVGDPNAVIRYPSSRCSRQRREQFAAELREAIYVAADRRVLRQGVSS